MEIISCDLEKAGHSFTRSGSFWSDNGRDVFLSIFKATLVYLKDVSGIIKPCRMTLLLGPPSSGKDHAPCLALAGELDKDLKVSGSVTYNVRETLAFSARCQGVGARYEMLTELSRREKEASIKPDPDLDIYMKDVFEMIIQLRLFNFAIFVIVGNSIRRQRAAFVTNYILKVLGLDGCADTLVGDQLIRGISGGQKKRVTTGEMLVGPAKALFMDEISTGPREHVLEFFESMGFRCPERKGVADFLQEVTSGKIRSSIGQTEMSLIGSSLLRNFPGHSNLSV
ncbi:hypothetical protein M0R45_010498 [Rubus argutus]|uniref:ABC transporter domain-containing protein n=1 Tax=Rubus argutus TaxID=59490 RepID=A0AAW1Y7X2_RUBAR